MGANYFTAKATGDNANEAFRRATDDARFESGHGGYSGTIAEKNDFILLTVPDHVVTMAKNTPYLLDDLIENEIECLSTHERRQLRDKWGPAGCIQIGNEEFVFFGWASS